MTEEPPHQSFEFSWVDEETLRYAELGRHMLIDVEIKSGFLGDERIVDATLLKEWIDSANGATSRLSIIDRDIIVYRIEGEFSLQRKKLRIAHEPE